MDIEDGAEPLRHVGSHARPLESSLRRIVVLANGVVGVPGGSAVGARELVRGVLHVHCPLVHRAQAGAVGTNFPSNRTPPNGMIRHKIKFLRVECQNA